MDTNAAPLATDTCYAAVKARDARFDGSFFTAVRTTGIFCRPICPAPTPKLENVSFHKSAAAAFAAGYRPCLRCRPELAPQAHAWLSGARLSAQVTEEIKRRLDDPPSVAEMATYAGVSERHLRRLFEEHLGTSPQAVLDTERLLFAKHLLSATALPVTQIASAAGYGSIRRFNDAFKAAYGNPPSALRRGTAAFNQHSDTTQLRMHLVVKPPFDWARLMHWHGPRAIPGVESIDATRYCRTLRLGNTIGWFEVAPVKDGLDFTLHAAMSHGLAGHLARVRQMLDLSANIAQIGAQLHDRVAEDALLERLLEHSPIGRLPGAWDPFELTVRAVLGQQVSVKGASTLMRRVVERHGTPSGIAHLPLCFPTPAALADANLDGLGITGARIRTLQALGRAVAEQPAFFTGIKTVEEAVGRLTRLPGIGPWTANYVAMRGLGLPDAWPTKDIGLVRAARALGFEGNFKALDAAAEAWRPWRAYVAFALWMSET